MMASSANEIWTEILVDGRNMPPTQAVVHLLSEYSNMSIDDVKNIVSNTAEISKTKWAEADRSTPEGLRAFYCSVSNWVFGNIAYHARQAENRDGPYPALPVQVADALTALPPGRHLDFGSGVGTASLLFHRYGWDIALADVSTPLLEFARWRLARADVPAEFIDLNTDALEDGRYDLITGFNTMAHVPDIQQTITQLRRALKPDGLLVFDIDARKPASGNEWFLYQHHHQVVRGIRALGFARASRIGALHAYRRTERSPVVNRCIGAFDRLRFSAVTMILGSLTRPIRNRIRRFRAGEGRVLGASAMPR